MYYIKETNDIIITPTIEEVLNTNFDYLKYRKTNIDIYNNQETYDNIEEIAEEIYNQINNPTEEEKIIFQYNTEITKLQEDYELNKINNPTQDMKKIAQKYQKQLLSYYKSSPPNTPKKIIPQNQNIKQTNNHLKQSPKKLTPEEKMSLIRIKEFIKNPSNSSNICLSDLMYLKTLSVYYKNRKIFDQVIRTICSNLDPKTNYDDKMNIPISELPKRKKS